MNVATSIGRHRLFLAIFGVIICTEVAAAQDKSYFPDGNLFTPLSSIPQPHPLGAGFEQVNAKTNIVQFLPAIAGLQPPDTLHPASVPNYYIETPASIACVYGMVHVEGGCNPNVVHQNKSGGSRTIAIVDAYDAPSAAGDLKVFSERFGLPTPEFQIVYAAGSRPSGAGVSTDVLKGWEIEISLDIEWAHAMAPGAKIILVEAASSSNADLLVAEQKASQLVSAAGGGEISNSWGGSEFATETQSDNHFAAAGVVYLAASGDQYYILYPASSPNVVAVGGTTIMRDHDGNFLGEKPWWNNKGGEGVGSSSAEPRPHFQDNIPAIITDARFKDWRGVPDIAAVADPIVGGVWVYDSENTAAATNGGWLAIGGTSVATPIITAFVNSASGFRGSSEKELTNLYNQLGSSNFTDIVTGTCGPSQFYSAGPKWDFCSGVGTPKGVGGL